MFTFVVGLAVVAALQGIGMLVWPVWRHTPVGVCARPEYGLSIGLDGLGSGVELCFVVVGCVGGDEFVCSIRRERQWLCGGIYCSSVV